MSDAQITIINEAAKTVAEHYARKMKAQGVSPTPDAVNAAVAANWDKVKREIAVLAAKSEALLVAA